MNVVKRLEQGVAAHQSGEFKDALIAYREVLAAEPQNPDALHFMGILAHQTDNNAKAAALIRESLSVDPNNAAAQNNLGNVLLSDSKPDEAAEAYAAAVALDPTQIDSVQNLGVLLRRIGQLDKAAEVLTQVTELSPQSAEAWHNLGICHMIMENIGAAADAFEACAGLGISDRLNPVWHARMLCAMGREQTALKHLERHLEREPGDPVALHQIAALSGEQPDKVSEAYIREHFNAFANSFDRTLEALEYRAPQIVADAVAEWRGDAPKAGLVLDLGCGTGLCGPLVAEHCAQVIGVDLSPAMLHKAAETGAYSALHEADLVTFLSAQADGSVDLAISADTLNYLGDLEPLMIQLARALKPRGALIATFEQGEAEAGRGYRLQNHGRFSHAPAYLAAVTGSAGLRIARQRDAVLRREAKQDVAGLILTIGRPVD